MQILITPSPLSAPRKKGLSQTSRIQGARLAIELLFQYSIQGKISRNTPTSKHTMMNSNTPSF